MLIDESNSRALALRDLGASVFRGVLMGLAILAVAAPFYSHFRTGVDRSPQLTATSTPSIVPVRIRLAEFNGLPSSEDVRKLADWISYSHDNGDAGFVVIDKKQAHAYVFDSTARLLGSSAVLLGATRGDDSVRGIGLRPLSQVRLAERTTPAGRFVAEPGRNLLGEDVVWVDYDAAISMHRVRTTNPAEQRLERLASENPDDKRISYGCINVPAAFYEAYVRPTFASQRAIVYVLPEIKPVEQMFGSHAVPTTASRRLAPSYL